MYISPHQLPETSSTLLAWQKLTKDDFEGFLTCRAREFKYNGVLALVLSSRPNWIEGVWDCMKEAKLKLYEIGVINRDQCQKLFVPVYLRSKDEINAALAKFKDIWKIEQWQSEDNICVRDPRNTWFEFV